eukprot:gnl/Spiro4/16739_TR9011_c0_g1_i1.p2 gnl/Spiro4/16739_TR9011_c0_g1~~gnl/Spiro4/16739_TR9011_c0_g1_i1.p2  ORF type:complete len:325 (+),score=106.21 gnl/Spiro4/16739_TR9011_c0_g1_i1:33-977(+)
MDTDNPSGDDPGMRLSRERVQAAKNDTSGRVYRVYCDGIFDMFHLGHMNMLRQAKMSLGDPAKVFLIAGVCSDELTHKLKGKTVMDHKTRCGSVEHCRWVDLVAPDAPWVLTDEFLDKYRVDFVAHDAIPYTNAISGSGGGDLYGHIKERGMFLETQRTEGISTTDLIVQIVRDYDEYIQRNLQRGLTYKELNVPRLVRALNVEHEKSEKLKKAFDETKFKIKCLKTAAVEFARQFDPRHKTTAEFAKQLCSGVPAKGGKMFSYVGGFLAALWLTLAALLSYLNPISYLRVFKTKYVLGMLVLVVTLAVLIRCW